MRLWNGPGAGEIEDPSIRKNCTAQAIRNAAGFLRHDRGDGELDAQMRTLRASRKAGEKHLGSCVKSTVGCKLDVTL